MDFKEKRPIYLQIADRLCDEILERKYAEDARIPSVREYAATVEVNVNTVVRSYDYLQDKQVIYNKRGLGYFVSPGGVATILAIRRVQFIEEELPAFFTRLRQLDIPIDEIVALYRSAK